MRPTLDPDAPKLCNNCLVREEKRTKKMENTEKEIHIQISCSLKTHNEIEELCINRGITLSKYFISLHEDSKKVENEPHNKIEISQEEKDFGEKTTKRKYNKKSHDENEENS